jgi:hypothetical protein
MKTKLMTTVATLALILPAFALVLESTEARARPLTRTPFAKLLCVSSRAGCTTTVDGVPTPELPQRFLVPTATVSGHAVEELVIDFVSGNCEGTARATVVSIDGLLGGPTFVPYAAAGEADLKMANTGDNFSTNRIPVAQSNDGAQGAQAFAQRTKLTYAPGTTVSVYFWSPKEGEMTCVVQLNGHFSFQRPDK